MKIFELIVDEAAELLGLDANSLVGKPAHEEAFYAFKNVDTEDLIKQELVKQMMLEQVKMVQRLPGEGKESYIGRCIPVLKGEGYADEQATAICYSEWENFKFDESEDIYELKIGDYQTRHFDVCPLASELYNKIASEEILVDMGLAIRAARLQDSLFWLEKHTVQEMKAASFEDVVAAQNLAYEIMQLAEMMGLTEEHQYIYSHVQAIRELAGETSFDMDVTGLPNYSNEVSGSVIEQPAQAFKFASEDQQIVVGPIMVPNKLILRINETTGEPYQVYFTEETIAKIAEATLRDELLNRLNVEHDPNQPIDGHMMSTWLVKDPEMDTSRAYGFKAYPKGTWFGMFRVTDKKVWERVKSGELTGFSIEGYFADKLVRE